MITQAGALNTTALVVPGLYVQITPPQNLLINGVPTDVLGIVGTATWGPVNTATIIGNMQAYAAAFGPVMARKYDMGTDVMIAVQQGAANFRCVRVTDGTDVAASTLIGGTGALTVTAKYTGTLGNLLSFTLGAGSAAGTWKATVGLPNQVPEVYDNISGTGNALWVAIAAAINNGNSITRGPSNLVAVSAGSSTAAPTAGTTSFSSATTQGSDGVASVTDATLLGSDATTPRTGMYALRGQGCGVAELAGINGFTNAAALSAFGLSETVYMVGAGPSGDTIANATSARPYDSYSLKLMFGDWCYWQDTVNAGLIRLVNPAPFIAGNLVNMTPNQSGLNKPLQNILGTQKSGLPGTGTKSVYATADLTALFSMGICVIGNPSPGGVYFSDLLGNNTSSNSGTQGDNYTRMTNYIATTLNAAMGIYVGQTITPDLFFNIAGSINGFCANLVQQKFLSKTKSSNTNGSKSLAQPYSVICDGTNNPASRTGLGYVQADVQVKYQAINTKFIVNIEGGQTVVLVNSSQTPQ